MANRQPGALILAVRYYVVSQDGQKYGPADIPTLNAWIVEGRLLPTNLLEDEASGQRVTASSVAELNFPAAQPMQQPPGFGGGQPYQQTYARPMMGGDDGSTDVRNAWMCGVAGLLCCCLINFWGLSFANKAEAKGNPGAKAAKIFLYIVIGIQVVGIIINIVVRLSGMGGAGFPR
jgi:hypothetical protein